MAISYFISKLLLFHVPQDQISWHYSKYPWVNLLCYYKYHKCKVTLLLQISLKWNPYWLYSICATSKLTWLYSIYPKRKFTWLYYTCLKKEVSLLYCKYIKSKYMVLNSIYPKSKFDFPIHALRWSWWLFQIYFCKSKIYWSKYPEIPGFCIHAFIIIFFLIQSTGSKDTNISDH